MNLAASASLTDKEWFRHFCTGMKWRMGEVKFQNEALTPDMVVKLSELLHEVWELSTDTDKRESVEELMSFVLIAFVAGLRGEEVPLTSLKGIPSFWDETRSEKDPYIMVVLFHPQGGSQEGRRTMIIAAATLSPMRWGRRDRGTTNDMHYQFNYERQPSNAA